MQSSADISAELYFTDFFEVAPQVLEEYGAFNISLINDLPLFIDPFLLFNSEEAEYQRLHEQMIDYLRFLRDKSVGGHIEKGLLKSWFTFSEVKQNWLGFSESGNSGSGLGSKFARELNRNLTAFFTDFGHERITEGSHLEKLTLIESGVGRDNVSDFTTNLIKNFLLDYTQAFAQRHIRTELRRCIAVDKVRFNYSTQVWESKNFDLPWDGEDYVLLTPKNILTKGRELDQSKRASSRLQRHRSVSRRWSTPRTDKQLLLHQATRGLQCERGAGSARRCYSAIPGTHRILHSL
jgi:hypothetical protein